MDQDKIDAIRERFERELTDFAAADVIGPGTRPNPGRAVRSVAEHFHRRGVPVTNGRVEGDSIVFDVASPKGVG